MVQNIWQFQVLQKYFYRNRGPRRDKLSWNSALNFRRVKHFWLCLIETQVVVLKLFFYKSNGQKSSPSVGFWWEKIEGNLSRANMELFMNFMTANTELSMDFRKAVTEPPMHFRRANGETCQKQNVNLTKRVGKCSVFLGLAGLLLRISIGLRPQEIPRSSPVSQGKT